MCAPAFVCGPLFGLNFHALRCGPRSGVLWPPLFETTFFVARNGFLAVSGNRFSSAVFGFFFSVFLVLFKCHFGGHFARFLRLGNIFVFFLVFGVSGLDGALQEVGRETLQKMGFRSNFAFWYLVHLRWTRCIASMLHEYFENNFGGSHKFVLIRKFEFLTKLGSETKKTVVLKMMFFPFLLGEDQFVKFLACF